MISTPRRALIAARFPTLTFFIGHVLARAAPFDYRAHVVAANSGL